MSAKKYQCPYCGVLLSYGEVHARVQHTYLKKKKR